MSIFSDDRDDEIDDTYEPEYDHEEYIRNKQARIQAQKDKEEAEQYYRNLDEMYLREQEAI